MRPEWSGSDEARNKAQREAFEVRRTLKRGEITFRQAVTDKRAWRTKVYRMLRQVRGFGHARATVALERCGVPENRRCGALKGEELERVCAYVKAKTGRG